MEENNIVELEEWKAVVGFEGLYEVSNLGRVRSVDRSITHSDGKVGNYKGKILKQTLNTLGRPTVVLYKDRKAYRKTSYSLVVLSFIGERPEDYDVCHKDGDVTNNKLSNLRYDTKSQNRLDYYRQGKKNPRGKLSIDEVLEIRKLYATGEYTKVKLGQMFKVTDVAIGCIVRREHFPWLNDDGTINKSKTAIS